ncbi:DUF6297 family protein [Arthrobacter pigmenti]|uniref:DUF6297 family protein n=1 Tax=Arthrobacter pigmenti TaxID=271432 RepID=UPI0031590021
MSSAVDVVRFTRRSSRRYNRARTSFGDLFIDVYTSVLALACAAALAVSFVLTLRGEFLDREPGASGIIPNPVLVIPDQALWVLLTFAVLAVVVLLGRRLGPIALGGPESAWWLPLPVDRRPMVWRPFLKRTVAVGIGSAVLYLPFSVLTELDRPLAEHGFAAATFGGLAAAALGVAALLQLKAGSGMLRVLVPAVFLAGSAGVVVLAPSVWTSVLGLVLPVLLLRVISPLAGTVPGAELMRAGGVSGHVGASIFLMNSNEVLRALSGGARSAHGRGARFYARPTRRPFVALLRADVVAFLRLHRTPTTALAWLAACVAVMLVDGGLPVFAQLAAVVVAGCATASGFGAVARRTALVPELGGLVPVSQTLVRSSRAVMPAVVMVAWMALLGAVLVVLGVVGPLLIPLAALAGVGMGAGSVRGATRPPTDWTAPPVETPFGPVPRAQFASSLRGVDVTVLSMIPVLLTLYLGAVFLPVLLVQAVVSGVVFLVVAMTASEGQGNA